MRPIDADLLEKQLLELAGDNPPMFHYSSEAIGVIRKQPTISALEKKIDSGWVKCSERLPDIELNQAKEERGNNAVYPTLITKEVMVKGKSRRIVNKAFYFSDNYDYGFSDKDCNTIDNVVAWQPLPKPYQESEVL